MIIGLVLVFFGFAIGWRSFMKKLREDFKIVKRTFYVIPIDMIIMNNYIKKFLRDNSTSKK